MALEFLTDELPFSAILADGDLFHVVDVSDNSQNAAGSSFKLTLAQLRAGIGNIYVSDGTLTANRTVLQGGNYLSYQGGNIGIGGVPASNTRFEVVSATNDPTKYIVKFQNAAVEPCFVIKEDGSVGFGITPTAKAHIKGSTSNETAYWFKGDNLIGSPMVYGRNDGWLGIGSDSPIGNGYTPILEVNSTPNLALGTPFQYNQVIHDSRSIAINRGGGIAFGGTYSNSGLITLFGGISAVKLLAGEGTEGKLTLWVRDGAGGAQYAMTSKTAGTGCYNGFGLNNPSAVVHIKGIYAPDPSLFLLKMENASGVARLSITDGGKIAAPCIQTGNAGLVTGELYVDTAANILANGDLIVARKV